MQLLKSKMTVLMTSIELQEKNAFCIKESFNFFNSANTRAYWIGEKMNFKNVMFGKVKFPCRISSSVGCRLVVGGDC